MNCRIFVILKNSEAATCSSVGTFAGLVGEAAPVGTSAGLLGEAAQEGTSAGLTEEVVQVGTSAGSAEVGKAQDILGVGTQEEVGRAACSAAVDKTFLWSLRV